MTEQAYCGGCGRVLRREPCRYCGWEPPPRFLLDAERWGRLMHLIHNPPKPTKALIKLMRGKTHGHLGEARDTGTGLASEGD